MPAEYAGGDIEAADKPPELIMYDSNDYFGSIIGDHRSQGLKANINNVKLTYIANTASKHER